MSGLNAWLVQRLSALYLLLFLPVMVLYLAYSDFDYAHWRSLFSLAVFKILFLLFSFGVLLHAWFGIRNIILDSVRPVGLRLLKLLLAVIYLFFNGVWLVHILWGGS